MTHLNQEQLLHLASVAAGEEGFSPEEIQQLEHLKTCPSCYAQFCIFSAVQDALDDGCYYDVMPAPAPARQAAPAKTSKILASLQVLTGRVHGLAETAVRQVSFLHAPLQFACAAPLAARGDSAAPQVLRLEEVGDDATRILFDPEQKELAVQIDFETAGSRQIHVYLSFPDAPDLEVPLHQEGGLAKGVLTQIPEQDFTIRIEAQ